MNVSAQTIMEETEKLILDALAVKPDEEWNLFLVHLIGAAAITLGSVSGPKRARACLISAANELVEKPQ